MQYIYIYSKHQFDYYYVTLVPLFIEDSDSSSEEEGIKPILKRQTRMTEDEWTKSLKDMVLTLKTECLNPKKGQAINTQCLDHLTVKKQRKYQSCCGNFGFMCPHNRCGFYDPKDCTATSIFCCHKNFDFSEAQWNTTAILRSSFMRTVDGQLGAFGRPALAFKWNHVVTFTKGMSYLSIA